MRTPLLFSLFIVLVLAGCGQSVQNPQTRSGPFDPSNRSIFDEAETSSDFQSFEPQKQAQGKIAILLPLSGPQSGIGQSMLQAAQLALFDFNQAGIELIPFDTRGTPDGARQAVQQSAQQNVKMILGPLLASSVESAGQEAQTHNLPVIGFTTDWTKTGGNTYTMGILPFDQGKRLAQFVSAHGLKNIISIEPQSLYGRAVISAFNQEATGKHTQIVQSVPYNGDANETAKQLAFLKGQYDGILIPVGQPDVTRLSQAMIQSGINPAETPWLGTGLWDDPSVQQNPSMAGAFFAAPDPASRTTFVSQYQNLYGQAPQRLASLAYDAMALSIVLLRDYETVTRAALLNPNGFAGVDGIFRFQSSGWAERGLAVHRITPGGQSVVSDQAPSSFLTNEASPFAAAR